MGGMYYTWNNFLKYFLGSYSIGYTLSKNYEQIFALLAKSVIQAESNEIVISKCYLGAMFYYFL